MNKDLIALMKILVKKSYTTIFDLETETNSSKRQIDYRLKKINQYISEKGLPTIKIGYQKEIILEPITKDFLIQLIRKSHDDKRYYFDKDERITFIYLMLFIKLEYLSLQHFISALKVSRSTVLLDIKELRQELAKINVEVKNNRMNGYFLDGSELEIRRFMIKMVQLSLENEQRSVVLDAIIKEFNLEPSQYLKHIITELSEKYGIKFVGTRLDEFIYIFTFLKERIKNTPNISLKYSDIPVIKIIKELKEYKFTQELLSYFSDTEYFNQQESIYLSAWILAISIGNSEETTPDQAVINEIVNHIMTRFEILSATHYKENADIFKQLYCHIRPAYYRLLFRLPIYNPLCYKIKDEYPELFLLVKETMKPFEGLFDGEIPDEEIVYLTMHFASIYSSNREQEEVKRKNALVVCSNGIGSSAILYNELKNLFPDLNFYPPIDAGKFNEFHHPVDIIFTTEFQLNLIESDIPIIKINTIIDPRERYELARKVYTLLDLSVYKQPSVNSIMEIIKKHAVVKNEELLYKELLNRCRANPIDIVEEKNEIRLLDMITEDHINLNLDVENWKEAIIESGLPLLKNNKITKGYIDNVLENFSPHFVISPLVALPHTRPEHGAISYAMGITTLKTPIAFGKSDKLVKYIFFLSSLESKKHLSAMSDLLNLLNRPDFFQLLDNVKEKSEIINYIKTHT